MTGDSAVRAIQYVIAVLEEKTITKHAREMALKQLRALQHAVEAGELTASIDREHTDSWET